MINIAVILGSTRPGRNGEAVAKWVLETARKRTDASFELVDLADYRLPNFDEPLPPVTWQYSKPHTHRWSNAVDAFDGYVFVTPEYNRAVPGALKNAVDFLFREWNNKAAGFVSYGASGGHHAAANLRMMLSELLVAHVRTELNLSLYTDFEHFSVFKPKPIHEQMLNKMLDELIAWSGALRGLRAASPQNAG